MVQLLDGGAEVNAKRDGDTSLILACHNGHVDAARLLLDRGGKAEDLVTRGGALGKGDAVEARRRRREKYYPCTITDDYGNGKYKVCYEDGRTDYRVDVNFIRKKPVSPLGVACARGHVEVATLLVERGASIDFCADGRNTPLFVACQGRKDSDNLNVVRWCVEHGADVNRADESGATPLFVACFRGLVDTARLLLERGAAVSPVTKKGATPLFVACENGHVEAARLLLDKGAQVNQATNKGITPLHACAIKDEEDVARLLLERGADVGRADAKGETPLDIARERERRRSSDVAALIEDWLYPLHAAAATGDVDAMRRLLDGGADINWTKEINARSRFDSDSDSDSDSDEDNPASATPLYVACANGQVDAAQLLLEKGADVARCAEVNISRRLACSTAWRCRFLTAQRSQHGRVIAAK